MIATCIQCGAPLTIADLGDDYCQNCHWQQVFEEPPGGAGELRLVLYQWPGQATVRDRRGRPWQRVADAAQAWCVLCGATVAAGWVQGPPGDIQTYVCGDHVDVISDRPARP